MPATAIQHQATTGHYQHQQLISSASPKPALRARVSGGLLMLDGWLMIWIHSWYSYLRACIWFVTFLPATLLYQGSFQPREQGDQSYGSPS